MKTIKNIIFDCDGVLIDSEILANQVEVDIKNELGLKITLEEQIRKFTGQSLRSQVMIDELKRLPSNYSELVDTRLKTVYPRDLKKLAGVDEVISSLKLPKAIASNSEPWWLDFKLKIVGLDQHFANSVFHGQMVKNAKPAPDIFLHVAETKGWNIEECLVVEDSKAGVTAAVAAGMRVCGFTGGQHISPGHDLELKALGAHFVISDLRELLILT